MEHKQFKPFDKVLVREISPYWSCDLYSHFNSDSETHETTALRNIKDCDILPYEGNEYLLGTTEEPEEEITIENGEYCFGADKDEITKLVNWQLFMFDCRDDSDDTFKERFGRGRYFDFAIRFSDFNPNDLDETRKHILCVRNGKIVRYKE